MTFSTNYADLLKRQAELQRLGGMPEPTAGQLRAALLDEIGELNHELKPLWAWWKKPGDGNEVNRERVLEEAADVLHFILLADVVNGDVKSVDEWGDEPMAAIFPPKPPHEYVRDLLRREGQNAADTLCSLVACFDFTPADLAHAYYLKTDENLRRWKEAADAAE